MLFFNKYIFYESTSEKTVLMYAENGHGKILITSITVCVLFVVF